MSKYRDYASRRDALERSAEILKGRIESAGGTWKAAGVIRDGRSYPAGVWGGEPIGSGRSCDPLICIATHAVPVEEGAGRLAGRFLVRDDSGDDVTEDEINRLEDEPETRSSAHV